MYYLKPRRDVYETFHAQGLDLPLLLLFGDVHRSNKGVCEDCDCEEDCCKLIYDKEFIREFDTIARETPVDFYTESSEHKEFYHKGSKSEDVLFKDFLYETVLPCHDTQLRKTSAYTEKCPTKFIRWHYGDIRKFSSVIEGMMLFPLSEYIHDVSQFPYRTTYDSMHRIFMKSSRHVANYDMFKNAIPYNRTFLLSLRQPLIEKNIDENDIKILHYIEKKKKDISTTLEDRIQYLNTLKENEFQKAIEYIHEHYKEVISEQMVPYLPLIIYTLNKTIQGAIKFKKAYIRLFLLACQRLIQWIDDYLSFILSLKEKSGILKQLEKQSVTELQDIELWRHMMIENGFRRFELIQEVMKLDLYQRKDKIISAKLFDKLEICLIDPLNNMSAYSLREYEPNEEMDKYIRGIVENIYVLIRMFNSSILDIYTITRMMKTPETKASNGSIQKEAQATLSLGFFGDSHVRKMVSILISSPFYYEVAYYNTQRSEKDNKRCIEMDERIPLIQDVNEHHAMRFEHNNTYSKSNEYYFRLRKEQRQRMGPSITHKRSLSKRSLSKRSLSKRSLSKRSLRPLHRSTIKNRPLSMSLKKSHVNSMNKKENV